MNIGIVAAKEHSKRLPNKNILSLNGCPMFWHSVRPLLESDMVKKVYVATDSSYIKEYCEERNVSVIWRSKNAAIDEDKLINILRYAHYCIDEECDTITTIMANCPGHTSEDVDKAILLLKNKSLREVRSFNTEGEESGLMVFSKKVMKTNSDISYYIGCTTDDVKEIHDCEDLDQDQLLKGRI